MSKTSNIGQSLGLLFVFAVCVALIGVDVAVSSAKGQPQNSNSSTTQDETTRGGLMTSNSNMDMSTTTSKPRRRTRKKKATPAATTDMQTGTMESTSPGEQTDLSGTYTGTVNYPEGGVTGPATVTITGNQFTLTPESGSPLSGRITAVTTRGYTGVTMMFGDLTPPDYKTAPPPLPAVSLRARRSGSSVTMSSVPGETREFSFKTKMSGSGRVKRRS